MKRFVLVLLTTSGCINSTGDALVTFQASASAAPDIGAVQGQPLRFTSLRPSCDCLSAAVSKESFASGEAGTVQRLLLRGVGPGLAKFGLTGALGDPVIKVYNSAGALIASNDDWSGADLAALAPFALDAGSKDAALIYSFSPGAYTLEVSTTGTAGEALAEIYSAP